MARATYSIGIESVWGALDSVKDGQANRCRLISRRHEYTENNYDEDGQKWHELYYYHMHEGEWSEGATRNRAMIKAAQRTAHDIERDPVLREPWVARYAVYRASLPDDCHKFYHFYQFVYATILRTMRSKTNS